MDKKKIKEIVCKRQEFNAPVVQKAFGIAYPEMKTILDELIQEKKIEFVSGMMYRKAAKSASNRQPYQPKSPMEELFIRALWECVKVGGASSSVIQRGCNVGFSVAMKAIEWMEENDYITPYPSRDIKITKEQYFDKFGKPKGLEEKDDGRRGFPFGSRQRPPFHLLDNDDDDDDDEDDDDYNIGLTDDDDDDDIEERIRKLIEGDESTDAPSDFRAVLIKSLESGLKDKDKDDKYVLGLTEDKQFDLKFSQSDCSLRISDGGKTFAQIGQTARRIRNVLKGYDQVILDENNEISVTVTNPTGALMALMTLYAAVDAVKKLK